MPLSTIFQLYLALSFIDEGNQSTWRKSPTNNISTCRTNISKIYSAYVYGRRNSILFFQNGIFIL
jgi:hypothetical protein